MSNAKKTYNESRITSTKDMDTGPKMNAKCQIADV